MREIMENTTQGLRPFGIGEKVKADDYTAGAVVIIKVAAFDGATEVVDRNGEIDMLPLYSVTVDGVSRTWTLTTFNQKIAKEKFGIKSYEALAGKVVTTRIKKYGIGNGFVITDVK